MKSYPEKVRFVKEEYEKAELPMAQTFLRLPWKVQENYPNIDILTVKIEK